MKKQKNKQGIKASKLAKAENKLKHQAEQMITVKNAEGEPDTQAKILIQNKISYTPKVSVIIPVYNVEEYLRECLDSVINQTLKEIEIICVDDGSTDNSLEILKEYARRDNRISVLAQENLHAGVARNAGLAVAQGEYVHFMDSDDWVEKNIYMIIPSKDRNDIIMFDSFKVDKILDKKISWKKSYLDRNNIAADINIYEFENAPNSPWGKLFSRKFIEKYNLKFQNLRCCNDIYFIKLSIALAEKILLIDKILYNWRFNAQGNISSTRGAYSECIVRAAELLKFSLIKENIFTIYQNIFYKTISKSFIYEYSQCIPEKREKLFKQYQNFLPEPYLSEVKEKITPEISIIMPVYNAEKTLRRAIDSLLKQTYRNFELICINDGSIDDSENILNFYKRFDERVQVFHKINEGPGIARNKGINIARGQYITFLDADDTLTPNALEIYLDTIKNTKADIVIAKYNYYSYLQKTVTKQGGHYSSKLLVNAEELKDNLYTISNPVVWNKFYKKDLLVRNNIYFPNLKSSEDVYFCALLLSYVKEIAFTNAALINWTYDNNSSLHYTSKSKNFEENYIVYLKLKDELTRRNKFTQNEDAFIKSFTHTCLWSFENIAIDKKEAITIAQKYIKLLDIRHNKYFYNRLEGVIDEINNRRNIIISLTSYPARIGTVNQTIESLLNQTMKADKVILWLAPEQFPNKEKDLPEQLLALCDKGLTIDWYHDIKSYKKLIPTLKKYPDSIIVTADDDIVYKRTCVEKLFQCMQSNSNCIIAHRTSRLMLKQEKLEIFPRIYYAKNIQTEYKDKIRKASAFNMQTGCGAVLYPPHCFYKDILNEELIMQLAPTNDDQWFWAMGLLNNFKVMVCPNNEFNIKYVPGTQDGECLWKINDKGEKLYFRDLNRILHYYPHIKTILAKEDHENKKAIVQIMEKEAKNIYTQELINWYQKTTNKYLNLSNPKTYNEKLQWLKLYDSTPIKTRLADKYLVRDWIKEKIGEQYLIPLLGVYDKFEEIDFNKLPNQFVIKCNHGSGWNIIVKDKSKLDLADTKTKLDKWMNTNFAFKYGYELHYKDITPKIIIEEYINPSFSNHEIQCWVFNKEIKFVSVETIKDGDNLERGTFYVDGKRTEFEISPNHYKKMECISSRKAFDKAIELAQKLIIDAPYVRIDFIEYEDDVRFREMTFTSGSGLSVIKPDKYNQILGNMIKLPKLAYNIDTGEYYKLPKKSKLKPYLLFPYNLCQKAYWGYEENKITKKYIQKQLSNSRIDIKNFGNENNAIGIETSAKVSKPTWFLDKQGQGQIVESSKKFQSLKIKAIQDGKLYLNFRGQDKRFEGVRFPVWIDYKSIKIDGKEILSAPVATWHDKPFRYEMPVKNGQRINVEVIQQYHQYNRDELKDLILKLNPNSDYIKENIDKITDRIYKKIFKNQTPYVPFVMRLKSEFQAKLKLLQNKFSFAHKIAPLTDLILQNQKQTLQALQEIKTKNAALENQNKELKKEIDILKNTVNQKLVVMEENLAHKLGEQKEVALQNKDNIITDINQVKENLQTKVKDFQDSVNQKLVVMEENLAHKLGEQKEVALQNKDNIITDINQVKENLQTKVKDFQDSVNQKLVKLDNLQENLNALSSLKEINLAQKDELNALSKMLGEQNSQFLDNVRELQYKSQRHYQELNFADLLHDSTSNSPWLKDKNFALYGWAANYSFIYTLFRILDNVKPAHILEMGLGQTSVLTSQYVANNNHEAKLDIIENDESWIKVYEPKLAKSQNIKLHQCDIEFIDYDGAQSRKYKEINKIAKDKKYNLIIVDGPFGGGQRLPRSNIVELVEHNLAQDFIIIFDDAERKGEQNTIAQTKAKLTELGIEFGTQQRDALKSQYLIFSKSYELAKYL